MDAVADLLVRREGIEPDVAAAAARATQGHVDRARRLATDPAARERRAAVLKLPLRVEDIGSALKAAQELVDAAAEDAKQLAEQRDTKETDELKAALGAVQGGRLPRGTAGVVKVLEDMQKRRRTRTQRDSLDVALTDLTSFYRDVLALQTGLPRGHRQRGRGGRPGAPGPGQLPRIHAPPHRGHRRLPRRPRPQRDPAPGGGSDDDGP
ncbi:hypothetical protein SHIRM173S_08876 [Streptomyces hirsutus]